MFRATLLWFANLIFTCHIAFTGFTGAQTAPAAPTTEKPYVPRSGQQGKDVIWLPTPQDVAIDLASGDGRTVITAAKLGARALGIEYNPDMVEYSGRQVAAAGMTERASFVRADLFETGFAEASVFTMSLLPDINRKLRPMILELEPGTRIVLNTFAIAERKPDAEAELHSQPGCDISFCRVLHWVVPQKVEGSCTVAQGEVKLEQEFQMPTVMLKHGTTVFTPSGRVYGEQIKLSAGEKQYRAHLSGGKLELRER